MANQMKPGPPDRNQIACGVVNRATGAAGHRVRNEEVHGTLDGRWFADIVRTRGTLIQFRPAQDAALMGVRTDLRQHASG